MFEVGALYNSTYGKALRCTGWDFRDRTWSFWPIDGSFRFFWADADGRALGDDGRVLGGESSPPVVLDKIVKKQETENGGCGMTLTEYAEKLAELAKKYPNVQVYCARDPEGNGLYRASRPSCDCFAKVPLARFLEYAIDPDDVKDFAEGEIERICVL